MNGPTEMAAEEWRRMVRERQGWCMACHAIVEGVDKYRSHHDDWTTHVVVCHLCGEEGICGAMHLRDVGLIVVREEPDRERLEARLYDGLPLSREMSDKCQYVCIDGEFECLPVMKHDKLVRLVARLDSLDRPALSRILEHAAFRYPELAKEYRMRGLTADFEPPGVASYTVGDAVGLRRIEGEP